MTVIITIDHPMDVDTIEKALSTALSWASEVIIVDTIGIPLREREHCHQLPCINTPVLIAHQQAALMASHNWILFLDPFHQLSEALLSELRSITTTTTVFYQAQQHNHWKTLVWQNTHVASQTPLLALRQAYLGHQQGCKPMQAKYLNNPLDYHIPDEGLLTWLNSQATSLAHVQLHQGNPQSTLLFQWIRETLGHGIFNGFLKGRLFRGKATCIPLFIELVQLHLKWLVLFRYSSKNAL